MMRRPLSFFNDGLLLRTYIVRSLVAYPNQLPHSTSHYQWLLEDSLDDMRGLLTVETQNHEKYVFGLRNSLKTINHEPTS